LAEAGVHIAARHFSNLKEDKARVLFGGMGLGNLSEKVRILTADTTDSASVDELLAQLDVMTRERDKLVHRLVEYDPQEGLKVTDSLTVKTISAVETKNFSITELQNMEMDCKRIF